ncbi:hypothetical protein [uncultured Christiangramia sp.]|uniref:hypothetical protein n=1 Tax=uncultured Christiangramia sp. TaxID=503836 RepID=UPI0026161399|nr:hypothetical protein [uncultured Christiangramia sp.]
MATIKDKLKNARANATLILMNKGTHFENGNLSEIPDEWENFPESNDLWKRLAFPEEQDTTALLYQGYSGSIFSPHVHNSSVEHCVILNPGGSIELITDKEIKTVDFPNSFYVEMGQPHAVKFLKDTVLLVMFHPSMKDGWEADFIHETNINLTSKG